MPEAIFGVDQDAQRRRVKRLGAERPALERPVGLAKGKERAGAEFLRHRLDDAARPAVQRIGGAVDVGREGVPHGRAGVADEEQGADAFEVRLVRLGMEAAAQDQAVGR